MDLYNFKLGTGPRLQKLEFFRRVEMRVWKFRMVPQSVQFKNVDDLFVHFRTRRFFVLEIRKWKLQTPILSFLAPVVLHLRTPRLKCIPTRGNEHALFMFDAQRSIIRAHRLDYTCNYDVTQLYELKCSLLMKAGSYN